jgi:hypothetical protein
VRHHDVGKASRGSSRRRAWNSSRTAQIAFAVSTPASARKSRDVAAAPHTPALLSPPPQSMRLHVGQEERLGKLLTKGWHDVRDAFVFSSGVPHFNDRHAACERRPATPSPADGGDVDRDLKRELGLELIEHAWPRPGG